MHERAVPGGSLDDVDSYGLALFRELLAGSVDPVPMPASADAGLLSVCAEFDALNDAYLATDFNAAPNTPEGDAAEAEQDRITAAHYPLVERMTELRAVTHAGRVARARSLIGWWPEIMADGDGTTSECLTHATLRDLIEAA